MPGADQIMYPMHWRLRCKQFGSHLLHLEGAPSISTPYAFWIAQALGRMRVSGDVSTAAAGAAVTAGAATESVDLSSQLQLDNIRETLIRQEDTIIFSIIERAQFAANAPVYQPDAVPVPEFAADGNISDCTSILICTCTRSQSLQLWCSSCAAELAALSHQLRVVM